MIRAQSLAGRLGCLCALTQPQCEPEGRGRLAGVESQRGMFVHIKATAEVCLCSCFCFVLNLSPQSQHSIVPSSLILAECSKGSKTRRSRIAGGALREMAAYTRKRDGQELRWCRERLLFLQHSTETARDMQVSRRSHGANNPLRVSQ